MSTRDRVHDVVVQALQKDGWTITDDPLRIPFAGTYVDVDLGAERLIAATKGTELIAVEIKSFMSASYVGEFHTALGQYLDYKEALAESEPERRLFLAVAEEVYRSFFSEPIIQRIVTRYGLRLLVFSPLSEEIVAWTN